MSTADVEIISNLNKGFDEPNDQHVFQNQDLNETMSVFMSKVRNQFQIDKCDKLVVKLKLLVVHADSEEHAGI